MIMQFKALRSAIQIYGLIKGFLDNPLVYKFVDHVTDVTSWTEIDNEVWAMLKKLFRIGAKDGEAEAIMADDLDAIQIRLDTGELNKEVVEPTPDEE
jgi:hypothetical protein